MRNIELDILFMLDVKSISFEIGFQRSFLKNIALDLV